MLLFIKRIRLLVNICFLVSLGASLASAKEGQCANRFSAKSQVLAEKPNLKIGERISNYPEHIFGVFQNAGFDPRQVPPYAKKLIKNGRLLEFDEFKRVLKSVDREIFNLTNQIVREDNIALYMFRHEKQTRGTFKSKFEQKGYTHSNIRESSYTLYGTQKVSDKMFPTHMFLWFRNLPGNIKMQFIYPKMWKRTGRSMGTIYDYFGANLFEVSVITEELKRRSIYSVGDFTFNASRNVHNEQRRLAKPEDQYNDDKLANIAVDPMIAFEGMFPMSDLRGLFLYVFNNLKSGKDYTHKAPEVLEMPATEVIEVTVWGPLEANLGVWHDIETYQLPNLQE